MNYYITYRGQQIGPMTKEQLLNYDLNPNSMVWHEGMAEWAPAYTIPELMAIMPVGAKNSCSAVASSGKSNVAAGIFALLLGGLGVQYFYCGKVGGGFICILLTLVTCGVWDIISLVQGIMMLCMSQEDFDRKYVLTDKTFPLF